MVFNIIYIQSKGRYDLVDQWGSELADAFESLGHHVIRITAENIKDFVNIYTQNKPHFSFTVNVSEIKIGDKFFFDAFQIPHYSYCIDHIIHQYYRWNIKSPYLYFGLLCETFVDYAVNEIGLPKDNVHLTSIGLNPYDFTPDVPKEFDIMLGCTFSEPSASIKHWEQQLPKDVCDILKFAKKYIEESKFLVDSISALRKSCKKFDIRFSREKQVNLEAGLFPLLDSWVRNQRKLLGLKAFSEFEVYCYGDIPNSEIISKAPKWKFLGPVSTRKFNALLGKSRFTLHFHQIMHRGAHDRPIRGMFAKSVPVCDSSSLYENIGMQNSAILYKYHQLSSVIPKLRVLLKDEDKRKIMADQGRKIALDNFTWKHRAEEIINFMMPHITERI